jgi:hypothetical protein
MPIRLNLLAEAQATEEMRRHDPVKRVIWVSAFIVTLLLVWASSLQLSAIVSKKELLTVYAKMSECTNDFAEVNVRQKALVEMTQKLAALNALTTNRFLNGNLLNAMQQTTVEGVRLTNLRVEQAFQFVEGTKARTNRSKVTPGTPPKVIEHTVLTIDGSDGSETPGDKVARVKEAMDKHPYFQTHLGETGVSWKRSSSPQPVAETGRPEVAFTFECRYPEITR